MPLVSGDERIPRGIDLDDGEVTVLILANYVGDRHSAVAKGHLHLAGILDHVKVGDNVSVRVPHKARPAARNFKVVGQLLAPGNGGVIHFDGDVDDGGIYLLVYIAQHGALVINTIGRRLHDNLSPWGGLLNRYLGTWPRGGTRSA